MKKKGEFQRLETQELKIDPFSGFRFPLNSKYTHFIKLRQNQDMVPHSVFICLGLRLYIGRRGLVPNVMAPNLGFLTP